MGNPCSVTGRRLADKQGLQEPFKSSIFVGQQDRDVGKKIQEEEIGFQQSPTVLRVH